MLDLWSWSPETVVAVTLLSLLLVALTVVFAMCVQAGLFYSINVKATKPEFGELVVLYKCSRGPYNSSSTLFTEAHSLMPQYNTIGVYYDDPQKTSSDNLRFIVGLVLSEGGAPVDTQDEKKLVTEGYKKVVFPEVQHAVVAHFPFTSTLSCIFSVFRVYPALREFVEKRELCAHPIMELYDNKSQRILFMGPLEQQDSFYVPDVTEDPEGASSLGEDEEDSIAEQEEGEEQEEESREGSDHPRDSFGSGWEQSASVLVSEPTKKSASTASAGPQGSAEESDTNTGSSFEEIDASDGSQSSTGRDQTSADTQQIFTPATPLADEDSHEPITATEAEQNSNVAAVPNAYVQLNASE